jgi:hypothetical protein
MSGSAAYADRDARELARDLGDEALRDPVLHAVMSSVRAGADVRAALVGAVKYLAGELRASVRRDLERLQHGTPPVYIGCEHCADAFESNGKRRER